MQQIEIIKNTNAKNPRAMVSMQSPSFVKSNAITESPKIQEQAQQFKLLCLYLFYERSFTLSNGITQHPSAAP
jgi:hypothetical protein